MLVSANLRRVLVVFAIVATTFSASPASPSYGQSGPFGDVPAGAFYTTPVTELAADGVFVGTECAEGFCPDDSMDRKTMAVWVVRLLDGRDPPAFVQTTFNDVDGQSFYAPFIERMAELGVTTGCGDGSGFCPDDSVTRAQMAVFLMRAYGLVDGPDPGFDDVDPGAWYASGVAALAASRITVGCGDGTGFCPNQHTTRAQMATFLHRAENRGSVVQPVRVPSDGSPVVVPAGAGFVAELGSVSVEGGPGIFARDNAVRVSHTAQGAGQHSGVEMAAAQPVLLDFGETETLAPLTVRFRTDRPGLKADHVTPAVWDSELQAWVPTIDEVTVTDEEIIVRTATGPSLAAADVVDGAVTVSAAGPVPPSVAALPIPCILSVWTFAYCGTKKVITVLVPAAWRTVEDAARALIGRVVDLAGLTANAIVATAREYVPKVIRAIEAGVAAGLEAGIAFYERWLLPSLNAIFGLRANPPTCLSTTPEWARGGIHFSDTNRRDPRVHLCSQAADDGDLHVKAVNNRNFGFQVSPQGGASYENFTAERPADISVGSLLVNDANGFLVDNAEALGGYQWPLSPASFDVEGFARSGRTDWTAQWLVTGATATLDAMLMGSSLMSRAADHVPFGAVALDAAECSAPIAGAVEQSSHWTAVLDTAGSCLSTASTVVSATVVGAPVGAMLEVGAQAMEAVVTGASVVKHRITGLEFGLELVRQPATLTITSTGAQPTTTTPPAVGPASVTIAVGGSAQGESGCSSRHCRHVSITLDAPEDTYDVECWSSRGSQPWGGGRWHWPSSSRWTERGCWYGYPGEQVWVTVDGVRSNTITWPSASVGAGGSHSHRGTVQFTTLSASEGSFCGIRVDGEIECWGTRYSYYNTPIPQGEFIAVASGSSHDCGIRANGAAECWTSDSQLEAFDADAVSSPPSGAFVEIAAGVLSACGLRPHGSVECWELVSEGRGYDALGFDRPGTDPPGSFSTISGELHQYCGVRDTGAVECWGSGSYQDYGHPPVRPPGVFKQVDAGGVYSCGLKLSGEASCWLFPSVQWDWDDPASDKYGQASPPSGVFTQVAAGWSHSCGLRPSGTVECWGNNEYGQASPPSGSFVNISVGWTVSCGLRPSGIAECWP